MTESSLFGLPVWTKLKHSCTYQIKKILAINLVLDFGLLASFLLITAWKPARKLFFWIFSLLVCSVTLLLKWINFILFFSFNKGQIVVHLLTNRDLFMSHFCQDALVQRHQSKCFVFNILWVWKLLLMDKSTPVWPSDRRRKYKNKYFCKFSLHFHLLFALCCIVAVYNLYAWSLDEFL